MYDDIRAEPGVERRDDLAAALMGVKKESGRLKLGGNLVLEHRQLLQFQLGGNGDEQVSLDVPKSNRRDVYRVFHERGRRNDDRYGVAFLVEGRHDFRGVRDACLDDPGETNEGRAVTAYDKPSVEFHNVRVAILENRELSDAAEGRGRQVVEGLPSTPLRETVPDDVEGGIASDDDGEGRDEENKVFFGENSLSSHLIDPPRGI